MMNTAYEMNDNMMEQVNGGTFFPNKYPEECYKSHGIKYKYHDFEADEFWLPDGTKTDASGANAYIEHTGCQNCISKARW